MVENLAVKFCLRFTGHIWSHLYHCPLAVWQHPPPSRAVDVVRLGVVQVVVVRVALIVVIPRGVAIGLGTLLVLVLS